MSDIIHNLKITDTAYGGAGVGRSDDGRVIFVEKAVDGDIVNAKITGSKKSYSQAGIIDIVKPSNNRITPNCKYFSECGGCSFSHIKYDYQVDIKKKIILNQFRNYKHSLPNIKVYKASNKNYRLRATMRAKGGQVGFYKKNSNTLVRVDNCLILHVSLFNKINEFARINNLSGKIYAIENEEELSLAYIEADVINYKDMAGFLGISLNNKKYGLQEINFNLPYGKGIATYNSFFQANRYLLNDFQKYSVDLIKSDNIVELYAGAGFFTCGLMKKCHIKACEKDNISQKLGKSLGYPIENSDSGKFLSKIKKCDSIFLDPPRIGADKQVIENIKRLAPNEIVYVSCNPITLSRDILKLDGYRITDFAFFDMYPETYHIESVVRLEKV